MNMSSLPSRSRPAPGVRGPSAGVLLLLALAACSGSDEADRASEAAVPVVLETVQTGAHTLPSRLFSGRVEAVQQGTVGFAVGGTVDKVAVDVGDVVAAGDELARIDRTRLQAALDAVTAESAAATARRDELLAGPRREAVTRAKEAVVAARSRSDLAASAARRFAAALEQQAVSAQDAEAAQRDADSAAASLREAEALLDELQKGTRAEQIAAQEAVVAQLQAQKARIQRDYDDGLLRAPYPAIVQRRLVELGGVVAAGTGAFELVGTASLRVRVGLPAREAAGGEAGLRSKLEAVRRTGQAIAIDTDELQLLPRVDARLRTVDVVVPVATDSSRTVRDGDRVDVALFGETVSGILVPQAALRAAPRGLFRCLVAVTQPDGALRAEQRDVLVDRMVGDRVLVSGGLVDGDRLIVSGAGHVLSGMRVVPTAEGEGK